MDQEPEQEGVVKFVCDYKEQTLPYRDITALVTWRNILCDLELMGRSRDRYGGVGFGNVSMRSENGFLVSGTQTGHLQKLGQDDFAEVIDWDIEQNRVTARGRVKPSSESLTHAAVYDLAPEIRFVLHVHDPLAWRHAHNLGIAETKPDIPYGTPAMAREVGRVWAAGKLPFVFSMAGHEDGVIAFGAEAGDTGRLLLRVTAAAQTLEQNT